MDSSHVPTIRIDNIPPLTLGAEQRWRGLVYENLGPEVEKLYQENTGMRIFEPAKLVREGLEQAVQLFNAELKGKNKKKGFDPDKLQTFEDVAEAVKAAAETWANRKRHFPQVQDKLVDFLHSAKHYQNLIAIFPSQSQYTSTFCAALKILITAATNYKETAEGLATALQEITAAAKSVSDLNGLFDTEEMRGHVVSFYASILRFCWVAVNWYQSKSRRILGNFKDDLYTEVSEVISSIKSSAETIQGVADKGSMAETRVIHTKLDYQGEVLKQCLEELKRQTWANHIFLMHVLQKPSKAGAIRRSHSGKGRRPSKSPGRKVLHKAGSPLGEAREENTSALVLHTYSQRETISYARNAFTFADRDRRKELKTCIKASGKNLGSYGKKFRNRLSSWMIESNSSILWIRGDPGSEKISTITSFAAQIINSALFAGITVIFQLCTFYPRESGQQPVVNLVQSLLLQVLESEQENIRTEVDLSETRFCQSKGSFHTAWALFEDILGLSSAQTIFIAIDCLERFDEDPDCGLLLKKLKGLSTANMTNKVIKLLLTSKRSTTSIFDELPKEVELRLRSGSGNSPSARGRYNWPQPGNSSSSTSVTPTWTDGGRPKEESGAKSDNSNHDREESLDIGEDTVDSLDSDSDE